MLQQGDTVLSPSQPCGAPLSPSFVVGASLGIHSKKTYKNKNKNRVVTYPCLDNFPCSLFHFAIYKRLLTSYTILIAAEIIKLTLVIVELPLLSCVDSPKLGSVRRNG